MNTILSTETFDAWLAKLKDQRGKGRILQRIDAARAGHFGDVKPIEEGVWEMRIDCGPGYRLYYLRAGEVVYLLLCGGNKSSQRRDIDRAVEMARSLKEE